MSDIKATVKFYRDDFPRTLFPLETNRLLIERSAAALRDWVYEQPAAPADGNLFLAQTKAFAAKPNFQLRRTLKLDALAEFFIYDFVYRHRARFPKAKRAARASFGYGFSKGGMESAAQSYRGFRTAVQSRISTYAYGVKTDVAQYFNCLLRDDLLAWSAGFAREPELALLRRFFTEIAHGRPVDCLPQGIYPAKVVGSHFLQFIEEAPELSSKETLRFMDDIYMFHDDPEVLARDLQSLQRLLDRRGLALNPCKTHIGPIDEINVKRTVDRLRAELVRQRTGVFVISGAEDPYADQEKQRPKLPPEKVSYLQDLLKDEHMAEEDAELIFALMREHAEDVLEHLDSMLARFPSLSKNLFHFARYVADKPALLEIVRKYVAKSPAIMEFQLFWLAKVCEDVLISTRGVTDVLIALFEHPAATVISKAKVLEIADKRAPLADLREQQLRDTESGWLAWCSAMGARAVKKKTARKQLLAHFAKQDRFNALIAQCVGTMR